MRHFLATVRTLAPLLAAILFAACQSPDPDASRAGTLVNLLVEDNLDMMYRDEALVVGKFKKMARSRYAYFRGTYPVFLHDQTVGVRAQSTAFGTAASSLVQVAGDPHPENIGSYRNAEGTIVIDINDFDAAGYGPYFHDVRRLALGFYVLGLEAGLGEDAALSVAEDVAWGYAEYLAEDDPRAHAATMAAPGEIHADLVEDALDDGGERKQLAKYTKVEDGVRSMVYAEAEIADAGFVTKEIVPVTPDELATVRALAARYAETVLVDRPSGFFAVKGASRRYGAGVTSYPVFRYFVLVEGDTESALDDVLLEFREVRDSALYDSRRQLFPRAPFRDNGERVTTLMRRAQSSALNDVYAGWGSLGAHAYKVRERTGYQDGLDAERVVDRTQRGKFSGGDMRSMARWSGGLLATSHSRAPTAEGRGGEGVIRTALGGDAAGFVQETKSFVATYGRATMDDYRLFRLALEHEGPLLGARLK